MYFEKRFVSRLFWKLFKSLSGRFFARGGSLMIKTESIDIV